LLEQSVHGFARVKGNGDPLSAQDHDGSLVGINTFESTIAQRLFEFLLIPIDRMNRAMVGRIVKDAQRQIDIDGLVESGASQGPFGKPAEFEDGRLQG
jgi:hypothetical protein